MLPSLREYFNRITTRADSDVSGDGGGGDVPTNPSSPSRSNGGDAHDANFGAASIDAASGNNTDDTAQSYVVEHEDPTNLTDNANDYSNGSNHANVLGIEKEKNYLNRVFNFRPILIIIILFLLLRRVSIHFGPNLFNGCDDFLLRGHTLQSDADFGPNPHHSEQQIEAKMNSDGLTAGAALFTNVNDAHDPFSIEVDLHAFEVYSPRPDASQSTPKLESVYDNIENFDNDQIVMNILSGDSPSAKRRKIATPTATPTNVCKSSDYRRRRDENPIEINESRTRYYAKSRKYLDLIEGATDKVLDILVDHKPSLIYNPESDDVPINVMKTVCSSNNDCTGLFSWNNLRSTAERVIYAHVRNADNRVVYVGYSSNYRQRQEFHARDRPAGYFDEHTAVRLVTFKSIPFSAQKKLVHVLSKLWEDISNLGDIPPTLKLLQTKLLQSWFRGGPKKQFIGQLIEIGAQRLYGMNPMAEAFMFDSKKESKLIRAARNAGNELARLIDRVWGVGVTIKKGQPFGISTWKTGAKEERLSSAIVATEYFLGNNNWRDTFPEAIYPDASTEEEIFAAPTEPDQLARGLSNFREYLRTYSDNSENRAFILLDSQDYLFGNIAETQVELCKLGFTRVTELLGGNIIAFQKQNVLVILHGHPALACESRSMITYKTRQTMATVIDALRIGRQRAVGENVKPSFDAIRGSLFAEISDHGWHGSKRFAAAICRDMMYSGDAIDALGAGITQNDIYLPFTERSNAVEEDRMLTMQRFTDSISQLGIESTVKMYDKFIPSHHLHDNWRTVLSWYQGHAELHRQVAKSVRALPSGGDVPRRQASINIYNEVKEAIANHIQSGRNHNDLKFLFVRKKGQTYDGDQFNGVTVYNLFTQTNSGLDLGTIVSMLNKSVTTQLQAKLVRLKKAQTIDFFNGIDITDELSLYELQPFPIG